MTSTDNDCTMQRVVLLRCKNKYIQAILAEDALLDLSVLQKFLDEEFVPVQRSTSETAIPISPLSEFPHLYNVMTLLDSSVDTQLLNFNRLIDEQINANDENSELIDKQLSISLDALKAHLSNTDKDFLKLEFSIDNSALQQEATNPENDQEQVIQSLKTFTTLRIKQRLEETLEIPPLSQTAQRIILLRSNPNAMVSELVEIVESDPSLAAQVVSWAASPFYASAGKVRSVQDAIVRVLGFNLVSNLALGLSLGKTLSLPKDKTNGVTPFWEQSIYCSMLVVAISKLLPAEQRPSEGLMYLSGLLHNFGYLVLAHTFPPHFSQICRYMEANPDISHMAIEQHLIKVSREQICVCLMQQWNIPKEVISAIRYQHSPHYNGSNCVYPNIIYLALRLLRQRGIGDAPLEDIAPHIYQKYNLNEDSLNHLFDEIIDSAEEIKAIADKFNG
ncbi:MAG: histidine kinase [SAR86 cluster bacterium]|uniref:Histidine kinase n=1 Tax=SAR86 cluster bacterium TaxID=2030880 RepID=A0A2A4MTU9_9GAMM|nr:MAG: histidine kinase [SAR86 cluster bacterium]